LGRYRRNHPGPRCFPPVLLPPTRRGARSPRIFPLPVLGWLFHRIYKKRYAQKSWILLWTLAIVTHPMLDMFTNYGTQFLWPLDARITFNTVFVIDPLYTVPFMIMLLIALLMKRDNPKRSKWNRAGIIWSTGYLLWGVVVKLILLGNVSAYFDDEKKNAGNSVVTPMPLTSFYWQIITQDERNYYVGYKSLFAPFKPEDVEVVPKKHELLTPVSWNDGTDRIAQLKYITNGYYALEQNRDTIRCYDLRFGTTAQLTAGDIKRPLMGYGMIVDKGVVQKSFLLAPGQAFKAVNFGHYIDKVFGK
jgi:inner membrane protein